MEQTPKEDILSPVWDRRLLSFPAVDLPLGSDTSASKPLVGLELLLRRPRDRQAERAVGTSGTDPLPLLTGSERGAGKTSRWRLR